MNENKPWHEDDSFWETFGPVMFTSERWAVVPSEVDQVITLLGVQAGATILDLGCGPGRHSLELARRGYRVTGVDRTAWYLDQARKQAQAEGLVIEFVQEDMRRFCRLEGFDVAINMFTAFGYFEDPADDRRVAEDLHRCLKPGGTLLMEMAGKEVLARIYQPTNWHEIDGALILEERKVCRDWSWMENRWIMLKDQKRYEANVGHRIYSATELLALLNDAGFASVDMFGDLGGSAYDQKAKRLVAVARK